MDSVTEFPFVASLPAAEKKAFRSIAVQWNELKTFIKESGHLVPISMTPKLAGVSRQRIHDLVEENRLVKKTFGCAVFITEESLMAYINSDRTPGRRALPTTLSGQIQLAREAVSDWQKK